MTTGLVYHPDYLAHDTGLMHPECAARLTAVLSRLDRTGLRAELTAISPREADTGWLATVHEASHLKRVADADLLTTGPGVTYLDPDTPMSAGSRRAALKAAGGVMAAVDQVMAGQVDNAFCLVRPPGHHAEPARAMGFCLYNSVAVAARYIQRHHGLQRVLIVDWDVHHGNGTQAAFWNDPTVFYYSAHQYPHYPGSGAEQERGAGEGEGTILNSPMSAGLGDADYVDTFERVLVPAADGFKPDFVLVSAGFDAHRADPLASMNLTSDGFGLLTSLVRDIAVRHCHGRLVSVLEGGYDLDALAESVHAHLEKLKAGAP
ncbi:MAG: histone deacetylase [Leptospirillia bacterium]